MNKNSNIYKEEKEANLRVDKAWNLLKDRLEADGLVDSSDVHEEPFFEHTENLHSYKWKFAFSGIAASFFVLLTISILLFKSIYTVKEESIDIKNSEANSTYVTTLEDGSTIFLAGKATLTKPKNFGKLRRTTKLEGDAFFDIARNTSRPFVIETALAKIEVLGTSFSVNDNMVSVRSGKVRVWLKKGGASTTLVAGEAAILEPGNLRTLSGIQSDSLLSRYTERMHFKDEKLINVINVINKNSTHCNKISLDNGLDERVLTATFLNENCESYAKLICIALDLKYDVTDKEIRIHR